MRSGSIGDLVVRRVALSVGLLQFRPGAVETDLTRGLDVVKVSPQSVANAAFDALEAGASEVLADERARTVKRGLTAELPIYL